MTNARISKDAYYLGIAREVARRFNAAYAPVFSEPEARTPPRGQLPRLDGSARLARDARSAIAFGEPRSAFAPRIEAMFSDPRRVRRDLPGHPDECPCFAYRSALAPERAAAGAAKLCAAAGWGCDECKTSLTAIVEDFLETVARRRAAWEQQPDRVLQLLGAGTRRARELARGIMPAVRAAMSLTYPELEGR